MSRMVYMIIGVVALVLAVVLLFNGYLLESIIAILMYLSSKLSEIDLQLSELKDKEV